MPAYNSEKYISEAIESVLAQSYKEWELIIIDDGSTDNTSNICMQYTKMDVRVHYFYKEKDVVQQEIWD